MTNGAAETARTERKAKVFISYSRSDMVFADRLEAALKARGFEPLIDRTEIFAFEDWWKRIEALIAQADTIVFVLSPESVASSICQKEADFAASLNKRFAPIVCRPVSPESAPTALSRLNWIFFDDAARFDASMDQLAKALETDIEWIRKHTEFGEHARRWAAAGRPGPRGLLLRSPALEEAERWIASRPHNAPAPTEATQAFIAESRRGATRRRNILTGSLAAGMLVTLALAGFAYWQRGIAVEQESIAQEQRRSAEEQRSVADEQRKSAEEQRGVADEQRRFAAEQRDVAERRRATTLAELATSERLRGNWDTALKLATHAARLALALDPDGTKIPTSGSALAASVFQSDLRLALIVPDNYSMLSATFSPDGMRIVTASNDKTARIWDSETGQEIKALIWHEESVKSAVFSPDGKRIVTASDDETARIWDSASGQEIMVLRGHEASVNSAAFSPDGKLIVTASDDKTARIWDSASGQQIMVLRGHQFSIASGTESSRVASAAFSPDGKRVITGEYLAARVWDIATGRQLAAMHVEPPDFSGEKLLNHISIPDAIDAGLIRSAAFSSDGKRVVTAGGLARIWDATTWKQIAVLDNAESAALVPSRLVLELADASSGDMRLSDHAARSMI